MYFDEIFASSLSGSENDPPVELLLAQQKMLKFNMYAYYAPRSAQYLRECIVHELERAERILLQRLASHEVAQHQRAINAARKELGMQDRPED